MTAIAMDRLVASFWTVAALVTVLSLTAIVTAVNLFGLGPVGATALYFVIWWTVLFVALPIGVRSQHETGDVVRGSEPGAPSAPNLRFKALLTTLLAGATLLFAAWFLPLAGL
jgi:predicted secreted protein